MKKFSFLAKKKKSDSWIETHTKQEKNKKDNQKITSALDHVIFGCMFLMFFLIPWIFFGATNQSIGFEKMIVFYALTLVGLGVWFVKGITEGEINFRRTPLDWPLLTLVVIYLLSTVFSVGVKDSLLGSYGNFTRGFFAILLFILFYYFLVNNIDLRRSKMLFKGLTVSAVLAVFYSFFQLLGFYILPWSFTHSASFNPMGSLNALAIFCLLVVPLLVVALILPSKEQKGKIDLPFLFKVVSGLGLVFALVILAFLNNFTFWIAGLIGISVILLFLLSRVIEVKKIYLIPSFAVFIFFLVFLMFGSVNFINLPTEVNLSPGASWDIAKQSVADRPFLGSGPSTFYHDFFLHKSVDFNQTSLWNVGFDRASGIFFEILATVGVLGLLAYIAIFLITVSTIFLVLSKSDKKESRLVLLSLFSSVVMFLIIGSFLSFNNSIILFSYLVLVLSLAMALAFTPEKERKTFKLSFAFSSHYALAMALVSLLALAGVIVLLVMGAKMYQADVYALKAVKASKLEKKVAHMEKAINLFPYQDKYYLGLANYYSSLANQATSENNNQQAQMYLNRAVNAGKEGLSLSPNNASNVRNMAMIYENTYFYSRDALKWAQKYYKEYRDLSPNNPIPYFKLGVIKMAQSKNASQSGEKEKLIKEAISKYDQALDKSKNLPSIYYSKGLAQEKTGDFSGAVENIARAAGLSRNNVNYLFELGRVYYNKGLSESDVLQNQEESGQGMQSPTPQQDVPVESETGTSTPGATSTQETATSTPVRQEQLSVDVDTRTDQEVEFNQDLENAEQLFLRVLQISPGNVNSLYALTSLYKNVGEEEKAQDSFDKLLNNLEEEEDKERVKEEFSELAE